MLNGNRSNPPARSAGGREEMMRKSYFAGPVTLNDFAANPPTTRAIDRTHSLIVGILPDWRIGTSAFATPAMIPTRLVK
jgi:hypothetical protein